MLLFIILIMGFGVAIFALISKDPLFKSSLRTIIALYEAALGRPTFQFDAEVDNPYTYTCIALLCIFTLLTYVVLLSIFVARMLVSICVGIGIQNTFAFLSNSVN